MFEGTYSHITARPKTRNALLKKEEGIEVLLDGVGTPSEKEVIHHFLADLKELLEFSSAVEVIKGIHAIEALLNKLQDKYPGLDLPNLNDFYQDLSPLLLQKYWEQRTNPLNEESTDHLFLESLFIAIEEEIYIWQEKIA